MAARCFKSKTTSFSINNYCSPSSDVTRHSSTTSWVHTDERTHTQTDRQTDGQTDGQTELCDCVAASATTASESWARHVQCHFETSLTTDKHTHRETNKQTDGRTDGHLEWLMELSSAQGACHLSPHRLTLKRHSIVIVSPTENSNQYRADNDHVVIGLLTHKKWLLVKLCLR